MTTCPKCGRTCYRGTARQVEPTECALEDGTACQAYVVGYGQGVRELGARLSRQFDGPAFDEVLDGVLEMEGGPIR